MSYKYYRTQRDFYNYVATITDELDINTSYKYSRHTFVTKDGEVHFASKINDALEMMNGIIGEDYFDASKSRIKGRQGYLIYFNDESETIEPVELISKEVILDEVVEEPVIEIEDKYEVDTPDWDWIDTLENNSDDKLLLDKYAEEKFNVKLSRTMKLENMIKKFKEKLD